MNRLLHRLKNILICCLTVVAAMSPVSGNCEGSTLQDEQHGEVLSATNRDGSAVKVVVRDHLKKDHREIIVFFRAALMGPTVLIGRFEQPLSSAPLVGAQIIDWDKDGEHEIGILSFCGAGPNCERTIYRVDKNKNALRLFFRAAGSDVELIEGYLVESSRDTCCSWISSAHKFVRSRQWVNPEASFSVRVEAPDKDRDTSTCTFYIDVPQGRRTINPPSKAFLKVCDVYGEGYVVIQPTKRLL
jgi:hypothetical protein